MFRIHDTLAATNHFHTFHCYSASISSSLASLRIVGETPHLPSMTLRSGFTETALRMRTSWNLFRRRKIWT
jgi:hypothetical protein